MRLWRNVSLSRRAIASAGLRSWLALLGLSVGVAVVITVTALATGAEREAVRRVESMGSNLLVVQAGRVRTRVGRPRQEALETTLTLEDAEAVAALLPFVRASAPIVEGAFPVKRGDVVTRTTVLGTAAAYPDVCNSALERGRLFTEEEERTSARVAVLGSQVARSLFGTEEANGETIRIRSIPFVVIGVLREKGGQADGANEDDKILVPIRAAMRRLLNTDHIKAVFVGVRSAGAMDAAERRIAGVLRERHRMARLGRQDDFTIQNQANALLAARRTSRSLATLGLAVALVSLALGGVGVLSLMLLSVRGRTAEIGLRMAVGSRPRDILVQFLLEAAFLGLAGGLAGAILGIGGAVLTAWLTTWPALVQPGAAVGAIAFAIAVSLVFGAYPAVKAAALDPVVALASD